MTDDQRAQLHALLLRPDGLDLAGRGHHQTYAGDENRRQTVRPHILIAWAMTRDLELDGDLPCGPAIKRGKRVWAMPRLVAGGKR